MPSPTSPFRCSSDSRHSSFSVVDHSMLENMDDDLARLYAAFVVAATVFVCVGFVVAVAMATAGASNVNDDSSQPPSSEAPLVLMPEALPADDVAETRAHRASAESMCVQIEGAREQTRNWLLQKLTCSGISFHLAGAKREPFADLFYRLACTRSPETTTLKLSLEQVDFGVKNCCKRNCAAQNQSCDNNCEIVFIYKIFIEVCPKHKALGTCHRRLLQPHHTPEIFELQRNPALNVHIPLFCPWRASVSYQIGKTVSRSAPAYGWSPARGDDATNSVSWKWELYRYLNGRRLQLNTAMWRSRPLLGISPDHMHIHPASFVAEASWELHPSAEIQLQENLEWDAKITLHTAVFRRMKPSLAHVASAGPIVCFQRRLTFSGQDKKDR